MKRQNDLIPTVFIDRDGVLNHDYGYVYKISDLKILPKVPEALKILKSQGYLLIVLTNQSGVARGYFDLQAVNTFNLHLAEKIFAANSIQIDDFFVCPHHKSGVVAEYSKDCECRKPLIKLIEDACAKWPIDLSRSYMIGDKVSDIDLALNANIKGIQIVSGQYERHQNADAYCESLYEAAEWISSDRSNTST